MKKTIASFFILFLTACTSPLPVPVVDLDDNCRDSSKKMCKFSEYSLNSLSDVNERFAFYATLWEREADKKRMQASAAGEVTFIGLLTSAIGLATKSTETIIVGGSAGAVGTIYNKRYALDIQSHNYDLASQIAQCMFIASSSYLNIDDDKAFRLLALESLFALKRKLRNIQTNLVLATPDFAALQTAISGGRVVMKNDDEQIAGVNFMINGHKAYVAVSTYFEEYSKRMKSCASQIGG